MSSPRPGWHVAAPDLARYAAGTLDDVPATSVEAHLLRCTECRSGLARVDGHGTQAAWQRLTDTIDRPSPDPLERLSRGRLTTRSVLATPLMVRAALLAVALVGVVPLGAALLAEDAAPLAVLLLAPLAPVAAVAVAYRDWADPAGEITLATPAAGLRLVAARALVVALAALTLTLVALLVLDRWVDVPTTLAFAWFLPGVALAGLVLLAGTTRLDPVVVAIALSGGWAAALALGAVGAQRGLRSAAVLDVVSGASVQLTALAVAAAALALTAARRDNVTYRRTA